MRLLLVLFCIFGFLIHGLTQPSDFITVKKKNRITVKSYFPGSIISCETIYGNYLTGEITSIHHDSVFIKQYQLVPNNFGINTVDTIGSYILGVHYKDIRIMIFTQRKSLPFFRNGTIFIIGGLGYMALNLINGAYLHEPVTSKENVRKLAIALGVTGAGFLLKYAELRSERNIKRYKIEYIHMNTPKLRGA